MFCPSCGRENAQGIKFCVSCGTNLEIVSQALSGSPDDFFTKADSGFDQMIARYAEHVFKDAPSHAADRRVGNSWKILGQGAVTTLADMFLFWLMWNILPLRFLILLISTPFRLLSQRGHQKKSSTAGIESRKSVALPDPQERWLPGSAPSISEHTTEHLAEYAPPERKQINERD
jgi:hypothetical protein